MVSQHDSYVRADWQFMELIEIKNVSRIALFANNIFLFLK